MDFVILGMFCSQVPKIAGKMASKTAGGAPGKVRVEIVRVMLNCQALLGIYGKTYNNLCKIVVQLDSGADSVAEVLRG